jgi:hypothetical protein
MTPHCSHETPLCRAGPYTPDQCYFCWLAENDPNYAAWREQGQAATSQARPRLPSLVRQAAMFGKAVVRHVVAGCPTASEEEKGRRMSLCLVCEHWLGGQCAKCGCALAAKTAWAREKCPVGKW